MMLRVEHIGIAVENLVQSIPLFESLLNTPCYKREVVESQAVETAFFKTGETKIELLAATVEGGIIDKYLQKNGPGVHHIAFEVQNIEAEMERLQRAGFVLLNHEPVQGADNKRICFLHPKATNGLLIELCQEIREEGL